MNPAARRPSGGASRFEASKCRPEGLKRLLAASQYRNAYCTFTSSWFDARPHRWSSRCVGSVGTLREEALRSPGPRMGAAGCGCRPRTSHPWARTSTGAVALVGHERVVARTVRVDGEHVAGAPVQVGVEHELHVVLVAERRFALPGESHEPARLRVVGADAEDERVAVGEHAHHGAAGGRGALSRLDLHEVGDGVRRRPHLYAGIGRRDWARVPRRRSSAALSRAGRHRKDEHASGRAAPRGRSGSPTHSRSSASLTSHPAAAPPTTTTRIASFACQR